MIRIDFLLSSGQNVAIVLGGAVGVEEGASNLSFPGHGNFPGSVAFF